MFAAGTLLTLSNVIRSRRPGAPAPADPWRADSLEWATTVAAARYNFTTIPVVPAAIRCGISIHSPRSAMQRMTSGAGLRRGRTAGRRRSPAASTPAEGALGVPAPTALPFVVALGVAVFFAGLLVSAAVVLVVGDRARLVALGTWTWRTERPPDDAPSTCRRHVPGRTPRRRATRIAWWGMVMLIATEAMIFAALLSAYFFVRASSSEWPQDGIEPPDLGRIGIFTVVLLGSSLPVFWGEAGDPARQRRPATRRPAHQLRSWARRSSSTR